MGTKPLFVETIGKRGKEQIVVVCDDGSVFISNWDDGDWSEMRPIPGTQREQEGRD